MARIRADRTPTASNEIRKMVSHDDFMLPLMSSDCGAHVQIYVTILGLSEDRPITKHLSLLSLAADF